MASGTKTKKVSDLEIIGLNSVGISLGGISKRTGIHHTTVTMRLKNLGISPADTRRAFMEDIYEELSEAQQQWLVDQLIGGRAVKDFVKSLILKEYVSRNSK